MLTREELNNIATNFSYISGKIDNKENQSAFDALAFYFDRRHNPNYAIYASLWTAPQNDDEDKVVNTLKNLLRRTAALVIEKIKENNANKNYGELFKQLTLLNQFYGFNLVIPPLSDLINLETIDPKQTLSSGKTWLQLAIEFKDYDAVKKLLEKGAPVTGVERNLVFELVSKQGMMPENIKLLILINHPIFNPAKTFNIKVINPNTKREEKIEISAKDFSNVKLLGSGNYGLVLRAKYNGTDKNFQDQLCLKTRDTNPTYWVGIKCSLLEKDEEFENEIEIASSARHAYLSASTNKDTFENIPFNAAEPSIEYQKAPVLFSKIEAYGIDENDEPVCDTVHSFLENQKKAHDPGQNGENFIQRGFQIRDILDSLYTSLSAVHNAKVIHLDLALRNMFMSTTRKNIENPNISVYSAKVADFGKAVSTENSVFFAENGKRQVPLRWASGERLNGKNITYMEDFYAFRMMIFEMLAIELGKDFYEIQGNTTVGELALDVATIGSRKAIEKYIKNVRELADKSGKPNVKRNVEAILSCFQDYLMNYQPAEDANDINNKRRSDTASFTNALMKFNHYLLHLSEKNQNELNNNNVNNLKIIADNLEPQINQDTQTQKDTEAKSEETIALESQSLNQTLAAKVKEYEELKTLCDKKEFTRIHFAKALFLLNNMMVDIYALKKMGVAPNNPSFKSLENDLKIIWKKKGNVNKKYQIIWESFNKTQGLHFATPDQNLKNFVASYEAMVQLDKQSSITKKYAIDRKTDPNTLKQDLSIQGLIGLNKQFIALTEQYGTNIDIKTMMALAALQGIPLSNELNKLMANLKEGKQFLDIAKQYDRLINSLAPNNDALRLKQSTPMHFKQMLKLESEKIIADKLEEFAKSHDYKGLRQFAAANKDALLSQEILNSYYSRIYFANIASVSNALIEQDQKLFFGIRPKEFFDSPHLNLDHALTYLEKLQQFIISDIAANTDLTTRAIAMEFWINVASYSLDNNQQKSINLAKTIIDALNSDEIKQLEKTQRGLSYAAQKRLTKLTANLSSNNNFKIVRKLMRQKSDAIPPLKVYKNDADNSQNTTQAYKLQKRFLDTQRNCLGQIKEEKNLNVITEIENMDVAKAKYEVKKSISSLEPKEFLGLDPELILPSKIDRTFADAVDKRLTAVSLDHAKKLHYAPLPISEDSKKQHYAPLSIGEVAPRIFKLDTDNIGQSLREEFKNITSLKDVANESPHYKVMAALYLMIHDDGKFFNLGSETNAKSIRDDKIALAIEFINELNLEDFETYYDLIYQNRLVIPNEITEHLDQRFKLKQQNIVFNHYPSKKELSDAISANMQNLKFVEASNQGKTNKGNKGGIYEFEYWAPEANNDDGPQFLHKQKILLKQDTEENLFTKKKIIRHDKSIAEYVTSEIMQELIGDSVSANIFVFPPDRNGDLSDKSEENIYIGSVYFDNMTELYEKMGVDKRTAFLELINKEDFIDALCTRDENGKLVCKYEDFNKILIGSLLPGDFDLHAGNIGIVPSSDSTKDGKMVRFDLAAGTYQLTNQVRMNSKAQHLSFNEPFNNFLNFPRELKTTPEFAEELIKQSKIDLTDRIKRIVNVLDDTFVSPKPLADYAEKRLGLDVKEIQKQIATEKDPEKLDRIKEKLLRDIQLFLEYKMQARQQSLKQLAMDIRVSLCLKLGDDGKTFAFQDVPSTFTIDDLINEDPLYFLKGNYHFRSKEHAKEILGFRFKKGMHQQLEMMVNNRLVDVLVGILRKALAENDAQKFEYIFANKRLMEALNDPTKSSIKDEISKLLKEYKTVINNIAQELYDNNNVLYRAGNIDGLKNASQNLTKRIIHDVLSEDSDQQRTLVLERWIAIMKKAYAMRDFQTVLSIYTALNDENVLKLHSNFQSLTKENTQFLNSMKSLFRDETTALQTEKIADFMNFQLSQASNVPCIPAMEYVEQGLRKPPHPNFFDGQEYSATQIRNNQSHSTRNLPNISSNAGPKLRDELNKPYSPAPPNQFAPTELEKSARSNKRAVLNTPRMNNFIERVDVTIPKKHVAQKPIVKAVDKKQPELFLTEEQKMQALIASLGNLVQLLDLAQRQTMQMASLYASTAGFFAQPAPVVQPTNPTTTPTNNIKNPSST